MKIKNMSGRIHPLMAGAAVSVMLVSLVGVAAITGILPTSKADQASVQTQPQVQTALMAPAQVQPNQPTQIVGGTQVMNNQLPAPSHKTAVHHTQQHHTRAASTTNVQQQVAADVCASCGRVESVNAVQSAAAPSGVGVGVGAVIGGLLGNQVGKGNGRTLATVAGAVGGGYAGNEVEKRTRTTTSYQVRVRMEDGETRTFPQTSGNGWHVGDRVRVVNGALTSRG